jgi:hypothetical protein
MEMNYMKYEHAHEVRVSWLSKHELRTEMHRFIAWRSEYLVFFLSMQHRLACRIVKHTRFAYEPGFPIFHM